MNTKQKPKIITQYIFNKLKNAKNQPLSKSNSLILSNKLTKSYFSLHDTSLSTQKNINKQSYRARDKQKVNIKIKGATSILLQRYQSQKTMSNQYGSITQIQPKSNIPHFNISLRRHNNKSLDNFNEKRTKSTKIFRSGANDNNKFKLLFRDSKARKSLSQRKIDRINMKIADISVHNKYLQSIKPVQQAKIVQQKPKPRGTIVDQYKIKKMVQILARSIQLIFSMYSHPKKVGDLMRAVEGYHEYFHKILFQNNNEAKFINQDDEILQHFWIFRQQGLRPETYGEQDLYLFNLLQNYSLKMQRAFIQIKRNFVTTQKHKLQNLKQSISKKLQVNQSKLLKINEIEQNQDIKAISNFVNERKRHSQDRRYATLTKLQSLGVRFNVEQRSKQLILTQKQKIMKGYKIEQKN